MANSKRKNTMDYMTAAFRFWARRGCPTYEEARDRIFNRALKSAEGQDPEKAVLYAEGEVARASAELCDVMACDIVFREFRESGNELICEAVREVYMVQPFIPIKRNDITNRVRAFSYKVPISEAQVYRYLARARKAFVTVRNLREDDPDEIKW